VNQACFLRIIPLHRNAAERLPVIPSQRESWHHYKIPTGRSAAKWSAPGRGGPGTGDLSFHYVVTFVFAAAFARALTDDADDIGKAIFKRDVINAGVERMQ